MILPGNGKVVIIDDQLTEAFPLMTLLSQEKVPFIYFQDEGGDDLPEQPLKNIRLVFLDLKLIASERTKDIISAIVSRLTRILSEDNGPYMMVVWSTHKSDYYADLLAEFDTKLKKYKPILIVTLPKSTYLRTEDGHKVLKDRASLTKINDVLKTKLSKKDSIYPFLFWENLVNNAAGDTTNTFTSFFEFDSKDWNKNTKNVLYKIAKAYSGKIIDKTPPDEIRQLKSALFTLNYSLIDGAENYISAIGELEELKGKVIENSQANAEFSAVVNNRLLISDEKEKGLIPGNVYILDKKNLSTDKAGHYRTILNGSVNRHMLPTIFKKDMLQDLKGVKGLERKKKHDKFVDKKFSEIKKDIFDRGEPVELHVSPVCDYAQNKLQLGRILPGILVKQEYREFIDTRHLFNYASPIFTISKDRYFLLFDFRFLFSMTITQLNANEPEFRVKQQLLTDIQIQLSNHINRQGVIFVD